MLSIKQLKIQAKELLKSIKNNDPDALTRFKEDFPQLPTEINLSDAQFVIARENGFKS